MLCINLCPRHRRHSTIMHPNPCQSNPNVSPCRPPATRHWNMDNRLRLLPLWKSIDHPSEFSSHLPRKRCGSSPNLLHPPHPLEEGRWTLITPCPPLFSLSTPDPAMWHQPSEALNARLLLNSCDPPMYLPLRPVRGLVLSIFTKSSTLVTTIQMTSEQHWLPRKTRNHSWPASSVAIGRSVAYPSTSLVHL